MLDLDDTDGRMDDHVRPARSCFPLHAENASILNTITFIISPAVSSTFHQRLSKPRLLFVIK